MSLLTLMGLELGVTSSNSNENQNQLIHPHDIRMAIEFGIIAVVVILIYVVTYCWEWITRRMKCCTNDEEIISAYNKHKKESQQNPREYLSVLIIYQIILLFCQNENVFYL